MGNCFFKNYWEQWDSFFLCFRVYWCPLCNMAAIIVDPFLLEGNGVDIVFLNDIAYVRDTVLLHLLLHGCNFKRLRLQNESSIKRDKKF